MTEGKPKTSSTIIHKSMMVVRTQQREETSASAVRLLLLMLMTSTSTSALATGDVSSDAHPTSSTPVHVQACYGIGEETLIEKSTSLSDHKILVVSFGDQPNTDCTWVIPASSDKASNVFVFDENFKTSSCGAASLSLLDKIPSPSNPKVTTKELFAEACEIESLQVMGRQGKDSVVRLKATGLTRTTLTLGTYMTYEWPEGLCPQSNDERLHIHPGQNKTTLGFPSFLTRLPSNFICNWFFDSSGHTGRGSRTVFNVQVEHVTDIADDGDNAEWNCTTVDDSLLVVIAEVPPVASVNGSEEIAWCRNNVTFRHQVVDGAFQLNFYSGHRDGALPFLLSFWAEAADYVCPATAVSLQMNATLGEVQVLKGVTPDNDQACRWTITAPSPDQVVMLIDVMYGVKSEAHGCSYNDQTLIFDVRFTTGSCSLRELFPYWSKGQTTEIQFLGRKISYIYIYYAAVRPGRCQGHPVTMVANETSQTLHEATFQEERVDDFSGHTPDRINQMTSWIGEETNTSGSICAWLLRSSGQAIRVTVKPNPCRQSAPSCEMEGLQLYDGISRDYGKLMHPSHASLTTDQLEYTSRGSSVLVVFNKNQGLTRLRHEDLSDLTFVTLGGYTGGAAALVRGEAILFVLSVCVSFELLVVK